MRFRHLWLPVLLLLVVSCSSTRSLDWHYIVPDRYQGFLVIRYDCPGGRPLTIRERQIVAAFNQDGLLCTSDTLVPTRGQVSVQTASGGPIPHVAVPREATGYGLFGIGTRLIGSETHANPGPDDIVIGIHWVGQMEDWVANLADMAPENETITYDLDLFLEDRLGMPRYRE